MKKTIYFESHGPSGNIFHILGQVRGVLHKEQRQDDYEQIKQKVTNSKSYAEALQAIREYVNLVDVNGKY